VEPAITVEGRNCWRHAHADRVAFLIDGAAYFDAFAAAAERAERSIMIVGWDIHSGVRLRRDGRRTDLPDTLGDFLAAILARRPGLHANVLAWDFAMIYTLEREPVPLLGPPWKKHPRLHFRFDGTHPLGASHHQKLVVIDDAVAFVGGFDLAACRWDTPAHRAHEPCRIDPGYAHYPPFHDVEVMVDGDAAAALGDLARERWHRATAASLPRAQAPADPWPAGVAPDVEDVPVAIARTAPAWHGRPPVYEVEALHLDAIAAARRSIYLETQYLTAPRLGAALIDRLGEPDGPEVVIVVPRTCSGWLEEVTMGVLRARLLRRLREADRHGRLRVYHPVVPGLVEDRCVNVHSKVLVVDDRLLRVGSANASSRSLRLDTECDVALEANGARRVGAAIAGFRSRLLGEHLGVPPERVAAAVAAAGSLGAAIESLRGGARTLVPLGDGEPAWVEDLVPDAALIDPEQPLPRHSLAMEVLLGQLSGSGRGFLVRAVAVLFGVVVLGAAWRWTQLGGWIAWAARSVQPFRASPIAALGVVAAFVAGGLLFVPVTGLIVGAALVFGPRLGFAYGLLGSLASAAVAYGLGRALGHDAVRRRVGPLAYRISPRLARRSVRAIATGRLVPIAPFTVVNLVAGAARIAPRAFALRTILALTPGTFLLVLLGDQVAHAVRAPHLGRIVGLVVLVVLLLLLGPLVRRHQWGHGEDLA
jgi:phospholipase D1/2